MGASVLSRSARLPHSSVTKASWRPANFMMPNLRSLGLRFARASRQVLPCLPPLRRALFVQAEQAGVAAGRGGVDGEGALGGEAVQVARAARLGAGAAEALAAERLYAHDGADHVAIDVGVADAQALGDVMHLAVDAAVHAEGEPVAGGIHRIQHVVEAIGAVMHDVEDR